MSALFMALMSVTVVRNPTAWGGSVAQNLGDPVFTTWLMRWSAHSLTTHPLRLLDANIFWPAHHTFLYAETLLTQAPLYNLVFLLTGHNLVFAYNATTCIVIFLNLVCAYLLGMWLFDRSSQAIVLAVAFGLCSFAIHMTGMLQLQTLLFFPLGYLVLFRFLAAPRYPTAVFLGLVVAATVLSAGYYGMILAVTIAVMIVAHLAVRRFRLPRSAWLSLGLAGGVAAVVVAPVFYGYMRASESMTRSFVAYGGLSPSDLVRPRESNLLFGWLVQHLPPRDWNHVVFVGFVTGALAVTGLVVFLLSWRKGRSDVDFVRTSRRGDLRLLLLAGAVATVLAVGPRIHGWPTPLGILHDYVPGFGAIRVSVRFMAVPVLVVAVFAACGYGWLRALIGPRWGRAVLLVAVVGLILLEHATPIPYTDIDQSPRVTAVYDELARRPSGPVVELPMIHDSTLQAATVEAPRMANSTRDWNPRVNGYSGYVPPSYPGYVAAADMFPGAPALDLFRSLHVRYVVIHVGSANAVPADPKSPPARVELTPDEVRTMLAGLPAGLHAERYGDSYLVDLGTPAHGRIA